MTPQPVAAATRRQNAGSSWAPEDREWLERFEWTPELRADYAERARRLVDRLVFGDENRLAELEPAGAGECSDCRRDVAARSRYRRLDVCRPCAARRAAAAMKLATDVASAEGAGT